MIILDTNVISALMRAQQEIPVVNWLDGQPKLSIWTTSITIFEIRYGLNTLPNGKRRGALELAFGTLVEDLFEARVAVFDIQSANAAAQISAKQKSMGYNVDMRDIMIGGICVANKAHLATRNIQDFRHSNITLINPWAAK